jgi:hypothetical protein
LDFYIQKNIQKIEFCFLFKPLKTTLFCEMTTLVITDIEMKMDIKKESQQAFELQRVNNELQRVNNELQRVKDELRLTKTRAKNYRILTGSVKATGKSVIAIAEFVVGATSLGIEFGTTVYKEYAPSRQQIFNWFGKKLEATSVAVSEIPLTLMIPEIPWKNTITC